MSLYLTFSRIKSLMHKSNKVNKPKSKGKKSVAKNFPEVGSRPSQMKKSIFAFAMLHLMNTLIRNGLL